MTTNPEPFEQAERRAEQVINPPRFRPMTFQQATSGTPSYNWVLYGIIPDKSVVALVSPPKIGKSFVAVDWAVHVARGSSWGDIETEQGHVVYLAGEGEQGFSKRLTAWRQEYGNPGDIPFTVLMDRINLLDAAGTVPALIEECKRLAAQSGYPLKMIVVDTVARSFVGGDENSGKDMGTFIDNVEKLKAACNCTVLLVHHMGKDQTKGMRGHTSLMGAVDAMITLGRDETRLITITVAEQKDFESGGRYPIRLRRVVVGTDKKDREVTSCVVERSEGEAARAKKLPDLKGNNKLAILALANVLLDYGKPVPGNAQVPKDTPAVDGKKWREESYRGWLAMVEDDKDKARQFNAAFRVLMEKGYIGMSAPYVWRVR